MKASGNASDNVIRGNRGDNVIDGGRGQDTLSGGDGNDTFVLSSARGADTILRFETDSDRIRIADRQLDIGDRDGRADGAVERDAPGGYTPASELVVFTQPTDGGLGKAAAVQAIGRAQAAYAEGQRAVFVVHDGADTAIYRFTSADDNAIVSAAELTQLATLEGVVAASDILFGGG